jgi:hypothetical protein
MANRFFFTDRGSLDKGLADLYCQFTAGTSGAVPTTRAAFTQINGFLSVVLSGTGLYTFNLQDPYLEIADYTVNVKQGTFDKTHAGMATLETNSVSSATAPLAAFQFRTTDGNGTAAAVTSGDIVRVHLTLRVKSSRT